MHLLQEWLVPGQQKVSKTVCCVKEDQRSEAAAGKGVLWREDREERIREEDQDAFCFSGSRLRSDLIAAGG